MRLALFDLDHTLLDGDSDVLWCQFLMAEGVLDRASFEPRNQAMERDYRAGVVSVQAFCEFYVGTLAGRSAADWQPLRERFWQLWVQPRLCPGTAALLARHRAQGDRLVMSTATNRYITELTAQGLAIADLLATEVDWADGICTGRTQGVLNMREGKVARLHTWLTEQGLDDAARTQALADAWFYSDSANDLPLLSAVGHPVVVHPDARLLAHAQAQGWPQISLRD